MAEEDATHNWANDSCEVPYQENKDSFISIMGEEKYHETIMSLLKKLPDPDVLRTIQMEETGNRRSETGVNGSDDDE